MLKYFSLQNTPRAIFFSGGVCMCVWCVYVCVWCVCMCESGVCVCVSRGGGGVCVCLCVCMYGWINQSGKHIKGGKICHG